MPRIIHPLAGLMAMLTIASFWLSTVLSELLGSEATVVSVKTTIPWGFLLLVPALAATGGSGFFLSNGQRQGLVGSKLRRMPFIAANGLLVLIPSALFLASKAKAGQFDAAFYAVQALELVAGAANLTLLALSMRDGLALTKWRRNSFLKPAANQEVKLTDCEVTSGETLVLRCTKPADFSFKAGQAVYLSLPETSGTSDKKGHARIFSLTSAPQDRQLEIATRQTGSAFKQALAAAAMGTSLRIEGPYGDLTLHEDAHCPAVFLAGGIGVTPFLSMVRDATNRGLHHRIFLFYSNKRPENAAFLAELRDLERRNPRFTRVTAFTEIEVDLQTDRMEQGRINTAMLSKYLGDLAQPVFYIAGPPTMVRHMQEQLIEASINPHKVKVLAFLGYDG